MFMAGVIWFTVYFTNPTSRVFPISLSICAAGLVALNQLLPGGILFAGVNNFDYLKLPWGEQIAFPDTNVSQWIFMSWSYYLAVFVYALVRCYRLLQSGLTRAVIVFGTNVVSLLLVTIFDISVDLRRIPSMYLSEFRFLPCVLSMAIYTSKNLKRITPE